MISSRLRRWCWRLWAVAGIVLVAVVGAATPASAHAGLLSASPGSGIGVPQPPGSVVLRFSEPLNLDLSRIAVLSRSGGDVGTGPVVAVPGDARAMQRKLGFLRPGEYLVRWASVSTVDGHTLHGSYSFGIGVAATVAETAAATPTSSEGPAGLAGRLLLLVGLTLWAGAAVLGPTAVKAGGRRRLVRAVGWAAPAAVAAGGAVVAVSSAVGATGSATQLPAVFASQSGAWRALTLAAGAAGSVLALRGKARSAGVLAVVAVVAEASSGHAAATSLPAVAVPILAVHLVAVGVWVFAIAAALTATGVRRVLARLSPAAVAAAAVVAATGAVNAVLELARPGDLADTGYGQTVVVKVEAVAVMAGLGLVNLRARRRGRAEPLLRRPLGGEAVAAVVALAAATLLAGFPNPPREAAASERLAGLDPQLAALTRRDALSLAGASGPFLVGVTILPPRPGPVQIRLQAVGAEPGDGLRDASIHATAPDQPEVAVTLRPCGLGCFTGDTSLPAAGDWAFAVQMTSNRSPVALTVSAPLPAPSGAEAVARAFSAMNGLATATMDERLRSTADSPVTDAAYRFRAPDTFAYSVSGADRVTVGDRTSARHNPEAPWVTEKGGQFTWPAGYFTAFWGPGVAARLLGRDTVDGHDTDVVAFVRPELPAWFRIWVDRDDGLVHREEMRAEGHLMDHHWSGFDQPVDIATPP